MFAYDIHNNTLHTHSKTLVFAAAAATAVPPPLLLLSPPAREWQSLSLSALIFDPSRARSDKGDKS